LLSRVTGFGRLVALAYALGFTRVTDSYNLANTTPNIIYDLVLGGIMASFIIPVFVDHLSSSDEDEAWEGISAVVTAAVVVLVGVTPGFGGLPPAGLRLYRLRRKHPRPRRPQAVPPAPAPP